MASNDKMNASSRVEVSVMSQVYDSYLSTPNFMKKLAEISDNLIPLENKKPYLMQELVKVNQQLPAAVYIPFVNQSMRNYAVLHIVAEESRIFKTKERCPLLLCIEVFRPAEVSLEDVPDALQVRRELAEQSAAQKRRVGGSVFGNVQENPYTGTDNNTDSSFFAAKKQSSQQRSGTVTGSFM